MSAGYVRQSFEVFGLRSFFPFLHIIKSGRSRRPPNMISISKSHWIVHSQFLQHLSPFLMEHPILKKSECLVIIKLQKRSESNVLTNFPIYRK